MTTSELFGRVDATAPFALCDDCPALATTVPFTKSMWKRGLVGPAGQVVGNSAVRWTAVMLIEYAALGSECRMRSAGNGECERGPASILAPPMKRWHALSAMRQ